MKLKNIKVGDYIEAKNVHGGDIGLDVLEVGKSYEVLGFNEYSDLSVIISVPNSRTFRDGLYVSPKCFRKPKLKHLDHSVFNGLDSKWKYAAVDGVGTLKVFTYEPKLSVSRTSFILLIGNTMDIGTGYDASNWRNSLIKRDIAEELLEVDLSSELTGSELCKAMLARGDKYVMCFVNDKDEEAAKNYKRVRVIHSYGVDYFDDTTEDMWDFAVPINSQGEPLTARDVGI